MKNLKLKTLALSLALAAGSAIASPINVGGVIWDPDQTAAFPGEVDFTSHGTLYENAALLPGVTHVTGRGLVTQINSAFPNQPAFCPGCELTYVFDMELVSITPLSSPPFPPSSSNFTFKNLSINVYVDHTPDYNGSLASAQDGVLWLSLVGHGDLTGIGMYIGTGSDMGSGSALLDVVGGLAMPYFDTNTKVDGADMEFTSSFQPASFYENGIPMLTGTFDLRGNSIPEPSVLALLGLGLFGLGIARRQKS
jgi:hypothetical protein